MRGYYFIDGQNSRVLRNVPQDELYTLTHYNVTPNYHQACLTPKVIIPRCKRVKNGRRPQMADGHLGQAQMATLIMLAI